MKAKALNKKMEMTSPRLFPVFLLWIAFACILPGCAATAAHHSEPKALPIIQKWSGDYPVSQLNRLPKDQRASRVGYLGDAATFTIVWQAFKPGEKVPEVNFNRNLVVFSRNTDFYNRTSIAKVILKDSVAEIIAVETMSAMPIEDKVAMALAEVSRAGIKFIQADTEQIPVVKGAAAVEPLQASYVVERQEVRLVDGRSEVQAAPGSTTTIKTWVLGKPVYGDLDGDADEDAAVLLVHDPGGSGTFYYVATALNVNGTYRGQNAVLVGDRVAPQSVEIRNGVVITHYADRRFEEPMTTPPSVSKSKYLAVRGDELEEMQIDGFEEQVLEGWVTIGHEVRLFLPCSGEADLWLLGNSPALTDIIAAHRQALTDRKRYAPLFMVLAGKYRAPSTDGFGAEYDGSFFATQLLRVWPRGNCKSEYIVVDAPYPGELITSPIRVCGRARGTWFFEGDFPIVLKDANGEIVAKGFVTAKDEWMTEKFVPFEGTLVFEKPKTVDRGTLTFKKDNPSDLPEHDDALEIPVLFK